MNVFATLKTVFFGSKFLSAPVPSDGTPRRDFVSALNGLMPLCRTIPGVHLAVDTRSRRGVPSEGTGLDRNLLPKKTVLRVANTFIRHFFRFDELQIYNMKKRLSRGEDK